MSNESPNTFSVIPELPNSVDNALKNLTDKPTQNAGNTIADIWYLVFGGISHAADKRKMKYAADLEQYRQSLNQSIASIPEAKKIEPSIQVAAQALENSKYCVSSETLRNMFVKLITGTMNSDIEPLTHPSFPEMIKQMSEYDALLLKELSQTTELYFPIAEYHEIFTENDGFFTLFSNAYISNIYNLSLDNCSCALTSLERMGLITISYDEYLTDDSKYLAFKNTTTYKELSSFVNQLNRNSHIDIQKGLCRITPLGKQFIKVCV